MTKSKSLSSTCAPVYVQTYSDPSRAQDKFSLPDIEIFLVTMSDARPFVESLDPEMIGDVHDACLADYVGWYWWICLPGCLPDSQPMGPFQSFDEAMSDMEETFWYWARDEDGKL